MRSIVVIEQRVDKYKQKEKKKGESCVLREKTMRGKEKKEKREKDK